MGWETRTVIVSDCAFSWPEGIDQISKLRSSLILAGVDSSNIVLHHRGERFRMFGIEFIPRPEDREYHDGACY